MKEGPLLYISMYIGYLNLTFKFSEKGMKYVTLRQFSGPTIHAC